MQALILVSVLSLFLFFAAYITRRRFGALGLALGAGLALHSSIGESLSSLAVSQNISISSLPITTLIGIILILGPAGILLMSGPAYRKGPVRLVGSLLFVVFGLTAVLPVIMPLLGNATGQQPFVFLVLNSSLIITGGIIIATIDMFMTHTSKRRERREKKAEH